jgi:hypothetical protein
MRRRRNFSQEWCNLYKIDVFEVWHGLYISSVNSNYSYLISSRTRTRTYFSTSHHQLPFEF